MASEHLIKITNKAKQLRRANPKLKWTDAVKKASKLIKPAAKKAAPKKRAVAKKVSGVKKRAPKKAAVKKHKDTKSHNVNIRVVSGVSQSDLIDKYKSLCSHERKLKSALENLKASRGTTPSEKYYIKSQTEIILRNLKATKEQKAIQKKLI